MKLSDRLLLTLAPPLAAALIRFLHVMLKVEIVGEERIQSFWQKEQAVILASWHDQLLMMVNAYHGPGGKILISPSKDGELIARTIQRFGHEAIRGSSSRGGSEAFKELAAAGEEFFDLCITPDGPKGPRHKAKLGVARLAKTTGRMVVPFSFACSHGHRFNSWDKFLVPFPWGRAVYHYGEPLCCRDDESVEEFCARVEVAMNHNTTVAQDHLKQYGYSAV